VHTLPCREIVLKEDNDFAEKMSKILHMAFAAMAHLAECTDNVCGDNNNNYNNNKNNNC
jgi:hypothetical protein